jgi:hypothetical protein
MVGNTVANTAGDVANTAGDVANTVGNTAEDVGDRGGLHQSLLRLDS